MIELAFVAWVFLVSHSHTTEMATGLHSARFLLDWTVMMVAMMFPAAALMILAFYKAQAIRHADEAFGSTWVFVAAYLLMWAVAGMAAYAGVLIAESAAIHASLGPVVAA